MTNEHEPSDRYDSPWKQIIERHFRAFLAFYFREVHDGLDWRVKPVFLEKELEQIRPDHTEGKKIVDKLVRVRLHEGREVWLYIHIEIQVDKDGTFTQRVFVYNYRLYDKFGHEVISLAVLGDDDPTWRPDTFTYGRFGSLTSITFPIAKLTDYDDKKEQLETEDNPFALATLAHLASRQTKNEPNARYAWKLKLFRLLLTKGWKAADIRDLIRFMDYMLTLPEALDKQLEETIHSETGEANMEYISSFERRAMKRGYDKGLNKGLDKGLDKGLGIGQRKGQRQLLRVLLEDRFGQLPQWADERLEKADEQTVLSWGKTFYKESSLESVLNHGK